MKEENPNRTVQRILTRADGLHPREISVLPLAAAVGSWLAHCLPGPPGNRTLSRSIVAPPPMDLRAGEEGQGRPGN